MKHLLYFAGYRMIVFRWQAGAFGGSAEFEPDDKGFAAFRDLLRNEVTGPVRLLADILEEDFRIETAPHLYGRDKIAVHNRLLNKYFRQYPHKSIRIQGRQDKLRRDDVVLLSALTNPGLFKPWIEILHELKIPLEGIYSLPLVGETLLKALGDPPRNMLVVSQQVPGNIRQSFYVDGKLKLSRLAPSSDEENSYYEVLREETQRTVRYLENQNLIVGNDPLEVFIVAPVKDHSYLDGVFSDDTRKRFHMMNRDSLVAALDIKTALPDQYCNWLYAHVVLKDRRVKHHYAAPGERKYFHYYQAKVGLYALTGAVAAMTLLGGAFLILQGYSFSNQQEQLRLETQQYERLYHEVVADISDLDLKVEDIRDAVDVAEELMPAYQQTPYGVMHTLSYSLERNTRVDLKDIKWVVTNDPNHTFGEKKKQVDERTSRLIQSGRKVMRYEKALIEAAVSEYQQNPRIAVEIVDAFIGDLRKANTENSVDVIKMPFDVDPASRTVGQGLEQSIRDNEAKFTFVMVKEEEVR
ncbi:MAG TPA: hypothetical protein VGL10_07750 [Gammaproteobacteria bacterium]